jgi:hypothetical protein
MNGDEIRKILMEFAFAPLVEETARSLRDRFSQLGQDVRLTVADLDRGILKVYFEDGRAFQIEGSTLSVGPGTSKGCECGGACKFRN